MRSTGGMESMDYENQLLGIARGRAVAFALAIARAGESTILGDC